MQSRLHRAQGAVNSRRNLVQRRTREETEFDHQAMLFRQARHGPANPLGIFGRFRGTIGCGRGAWHLAKAVWCGKPGGLLVSPSFQESVPENAV